MGGPDVLEHDVPATAALSDLNLGATGAPRYPPHEHHKPRLPTPGVCHPRLPQAPDQHRYPRDPTTSLKWHESGPGLTSTGLVPCGGDGWEAVEECSGVGGDGGVGGELVALDRDDR